MARKIPKVIQQAVRHRANFLCEYCHTAEKWQYVMFTIEHVIPVSLGGDDSFDNLALSCFACNRRKSDKIKGLDPHVNKIVQLFNPRVHQWNENFIWSKDKLVIAGLTSIGRATIHELELNRDRIINIRKADLKVYRHPPENDLIL